MQEPPVSVSHLSFFFFFFSLREKAVQVLRADWVLGKPRSEVALLLAPFRCPWVSMQSQGHREAPLGPPSTSAQFLPCFPPHCENVHSQPLGRNQHDGMCCPAASGQDGPTGEGASEESSGRSELGRKTEMCPGSRPGSPSPAIVPGPTGQVHWALGRIPASTQHCPSLP